MKRLFRRRDETPADLVHDELLVTRARSHALVEESRERVVVLDSERRVVAASRLAREVADGIAVGRLLPAHVTEALESGDAVAIPIEVGESSESLVYLEPPGDADSYQELRVGFTAAVSHELRTPLARLMVLLDSMGLPGADARELVARARAEVLQVGELIDDVLFLSELEEGRAVVSLGSTAALPVLEGVLADRAERAEIAGVVLRLDCPAGIELPLRPRMLDTVAGNLTDNAVRYAGQGSTFTLSVRDGVDATVLTGSDTGVGVPSEDLSRLFERFYRSDRARSSHGTGLGLAIVKHIVTAAGGSVEAVAGPSGGVEIRCRFPRASVTGP